MYTLNLLCIDILSQTRTLFYSLALSYLFALVICKYNLRRFVGKLSVVTRLFVSSTI